MPASGGNIVQSAHSDNTEAIQGANLNDIRQIVNDQVLSSLKNALPKLLQQAMEESKSKNDTGLTSDNPLESSISDATHSARMERYYSSKKETELSEEVLAFVKTAFSKQLDKEIWTNLMDKYPQLKGADNILVAPSMESGMKEHIVKKFGYHKTKDVFSTDEAIAARQAPFITVARPLAAALEILEDPSDDEDQGIDPDVIKALVEDALVLLGNANMRLNNWRQKRFSEFLTEVGKRTLKEEIPTDKHLFPDKFHKVIQSEHDHSTTNSKLITTPIKHTSKDQYAFKKPFRSQTQSGSEYRQGGKRRWISKGTSRGFKRPASDNTYYNKDNSSKKGKYSKEPTSNQS